MNIRLKTALFLGGALALLMAGLYGALVKVTGAGFSKVEHDATDNSLAQAREAFIAQYDEVCAKSLDWAQWDDSYEYVNDRNQTYYDANLAEIAFEGINLDFVLIANAENEIVSALQAGTGADDENGPLDTHIVKTGFQKNSVFLPAWKSAEKKRSGMLIGDGFPPAIVCSIPITRSDGSGKIRGSFVFGRLFNEAREKEMAKRLKMSMSFYTSDSEGYKSKQSIIDNLKTPDAVYAEFVDETKIIGYTQFADIEGNHRLLTVVELNRDVNAQAQKSMNAVLISLVALGAVAVLLLVLLIDRIVIKRVLALASLVHTVTEGFEFSKRVNQEGSDELSGLAVEVNGMIAAMEQVMYVMQEAEGKWTSLKSNLPQPLCILKPTLGTDGELTELYLSEANQAFTKLKNITPEDTMTKSVAEVLAVLGNPDKWKQAIVESAAKQTCVEVYEKTVLFPTGDGQIAAVLSDAANRKEA